jgi:hypothetical protein
MFPDMPSNIYLLASATSVFRIKIVGKIETLPAGNEAL